MSRVRGSVAGAVICLAWGAFQARGQAQTSGAEEVPVVPAETAAEPLAGYEGGFFIQSADGNYRLVAGGRLQPLLQVEVPEEGDNRAAVSIRRARISFKGHLFMPELTWLFQVEFGRGSVSLLDYYANYAFAEGLQLRIGSWKRPFSRQLISSSGRLELVDRAITNDAFNADRDIGLMLHNGYESSPPFEWAVGVFNGTGIASRLRAGVAVDPATGEGAVTSASSTNVPDVFHPAVVFRVGLNTGGIRGYSEGDLEGGGPRLAAGLSGRADFDAANDDQSALRGEIDFSFKAMGFGTSGAVYVSSAQDGEGFGDQAFDAWGAHLQAGYVIAERFQPVVRYARVEPEGEGARQEVTAGFGIYFAGHNLKWQSDASLLTEEAEDAEVQDWRVRTQFTLAF